MGTMNMSELINSGSFVTADMLSRPDEQLPDYETNTHSSWAAFYLYLPRSSGRTIFSHSDKEGGRH